MKLLLKRSCLLMVCIGALFISPVYAYQVQVLPASILPGDPFLVRLTGLDRRYGPAATFRGKEISLVSCGSGCFAGIAAADIKTRPGRYRVNISVGARRRHVPVTVAHHRFPVIRLSLPQELVSLSAEDSTRAEREEKRLKALWSVRSDKMWEGAFGLPLANEVSTQYGVTRIMNGSKESIHRGIDIRGAMGEEVKASNSGKIVLAEELYFGGKTLVIDHGTGIYTVYMHLSGFTRAQGDSVSKDEVIGYVGSTGRSTGPHLHFGVKVQELSVNPVSVTKLKL